MGLILSIASGVTNFAGDWVLIQLIGLPGAAWATVAGYCVGGIIPLVFFITHRSGLHLTGTKLYIREFLQACGNGASELMSNISSSLVGILYNLELMRLVGERGVAAHSVMMYVDFVFIAAFLGFSIGSAPIISYHFGAENHDELKNVFRRSMFLILVTSGAMVVLSEALCRPLCAAFVGYSPDLMQLTVHGFRLFVLCYLFCGVNIYASAFFTALCNGALSAFISFLRSLLLRGGLVLLLPPVLGLDGVWLAVVAAEGLSAAVSAVLLRRQRTRYHYL
ncbi:MATE family efflux transporter [Agathobaculum hominis]